MTAFACKRAVPSTDRENMQPQNPPSYSKKTREPRSFEGESDADEVDPNGMTKNRTDKRLRTRTAALIFDIFSPNSFTHLSPAFLCRIGLCSPRVAFRSEEHTSELQSRGHL